MKRIMFLIIAISTQIVGFAQSEKYIKKMESLVPQVDTTGTEYGLSTLANTFENIATIEKTQWLPYYYAALSCANICNTYFIKNETNKIDPVADKGIILINKALEIEPNNTEIYCVVKMLYTSKMMVDPMSRYEEYGGKAANALEKAKTLNADNPRVYLLTGIDKYYTPEQYGGSKTEAKTMFETGLKKLETYKTTSSIYPSWGKPQFEYFLSLKD